MNNRELNQAMKEAVAKERRITVHILKLIALAEQQKAHLELGYGSLHAWLTHEHKYSDGAADRRIRAARLLREVPESEAKLETGIISVSNLAKAQAMIQRQGNVSPEVKREAVRLIENQTQLQAEQNLCGLLPANNSSLWRESISVIDQHNLRLAVNLPNVAISDLNRIRELLSHKFPSCEAGLILPEVFVDYLRRHDPLLQKPAKPSRRASRKYVIQQAQGSCEYEDPVTGKICGAKVRVERDHIIPRANGGDDSIQNARALCDQHNRYMSEITLGRERANRWRKRRPDQG